MVKTLEPEVIDLLLPFLFVSRSGTSSERSASMRELGHEGLGLLWRVAEVRLEAVVPDGPAGYGFDAGDFSVLLNSKLFAQTSISTARAGLKFREEEVNGDDIITVRVDRISFVPPDGIVVRVRLENTHRADQ